MNIKYMSLISVLFVASASAITVTEQLDAAKKALNDCRASKYRISCNREEERFKQDVLKFVSPHHTKMEEGIKKSREIVSEPQSLRERVPFLGNDIREKRLQKYNENYYETWGHGWVFEAFAGRSNYDFLSSEKSASEFAEYIVNDSYGPGQSSYVEDMLGNRAIWNADKPENKPLVKAAQEKVKRMIKQQAETPLQK